MDEHIRCPECGGVIAGIEVWGVYDGALFWQCLDCSYPFHRWPTDDYRYAKAQPFIDQIKADRAART